MRFGLLCLALSTQLYPVTLKDIMQAFHDARAKSLSLSLKILENPTSEPSKEELEDLEHLRDKANGFLGEARDNDNFWDIFMFYDGHLQALAHQLCTEKIDGIRASSPFKKAPNEDAKQKVMLLTEEAIRLDLMKVWLGNSSLVCAE